MTAGPRIISLDMIVASYSNIRHTVRHKMREAIYISHGGFHTPLPADFPELVPSTS